MSIIYEALQKTQKKRQAALPTSIKATPSEVVKEAISKAEVEIESKDQAAPYEWVDILLMIAISGLFVVLVFACYGRVIAKHHAQKIQPIALSKPTVAMQPVFNLAVYKQKHLLNGVFLSGEDNFAMIDNKYVHVGDTVDGFTLIGLSLNFVKLQKGKDVIILKS
jgi:hypothetical protein